MRIISGKARGTKLYTLEGKNTRPTLDRVKESLFNILQSKLQDATVLDVFSGSGALALESLSRGARKAILFDNSKQAISIIKRNIEKTHFEPQTEVFLKDYKQGLKLINEKVDVVFVDPPYEQNIAAKAVEQIIKQDILKEDGIIILETDNVEREYKQLEIIKNINIKDLREYGRVKLIFLNRKG